MKNNLSKEINLLLDLVKFSYNKPAWQGTNVSGSLRGVGFEEAAWRPAKNRHNIWEIVVHMSYWKYTAAKRLLGIRKVFFPYKGRDWFYKPEIKSEKEWEKDKKLLNDMHDLLLKNINEFDSANLYKSIPRSKNTAAYLIYGIASHDVYHTGQIQLIKKFYEERK